MGESVLRFPLGRKLIIRQGVEKMERERQTGQAGKKVTDRIDGFESGYAEYAGKDPDQWDEVDALAEA